jgi:hypothetical protein
MTIFSLSKVVETAKEYARGTKVATTQRAYAADWRDYTACCCRHNLNPLPSDPQTVGLYLAALASDGAGKTKSLSFCHSLFI